MGATTFTQYAFCIGYACSRRVVNLFVFFGSSLTIRRSRTATLAPFRFFFVQVIFRPCQLKVVGLLASGLHCVFDQGSTSIVLCEGLGVFVDLLDVCLRCAPFQDVFSNVLNWYVGRGRDRHFVDLRRYLYEFCFGPLFLRFGNFASFACRFGRFIWFGVLCVRAGQALFRLGPRDRCVVVFVSYDCRLISMLVLFFLCPVIICGTLFHRFVGFVSGSICVQVSSVRGNRA